MSAATLEASATAAITQLVTPVPMGAEAKLTKKALTADHPTWCPSCGDFAVLAAFYKVLEKLQYPHEKIVRVAAFKLANLPSPGKFGVFYDVDRATKNALEQKWIDDTQTKLAGTSHKDLLKKRLEMMR